MITLDHHEGCFMTHTRSLNIVEIQYCVDRHTTMAYTALACMASSGKNRTKNPFRVLAASQIWLRTCPRSALMLIHAHFNIFGIWLLIGSKSKKLQMAHTCAANGLSENAVVENMGWQYMGVERWSAYYGKSNMESKLSHVRFVHDCQQ